MPEDHAALLSTLIQFGCATQELSPNFPSSFPKQGIESMVRCRESVKKLPMIPAIYRMLRKRYISYQLKSKNTEQVFTDIYKCNTWRGKDSISGWGSELYQTQIIIRELPALFDDLGIVTILDIPCGDFHWMKEVDLSNIDYKGADIVTELININVCKFERSGVHFMNLNLINDKLPHVDLILCRDCLVHFSFADICRALTNMCNSQSKYILTTTFTGRKKNYDIQTGLWRVLNLELTPFMLPPPLRVINEGCTQGDGAYRDKSLGLWRAADIIRNNILSRRCLV